MDEQAIREPHPRRQGGAGLTRRALRADHGGARPDRAPWPRRCSPPRAWPRSPRRQRRPSRPTKRGGGGPLKVLWWQAPTLLNPALRHRHQGPGRLAHLLRAARRASTPTATWCPSWPPRCRARQNGGAGQGRHLGHLEAQEERALARRQALHRRRRRLQLGVRGRPRHRGRHHRLLPRHRAHREARHPHRQARLQEAHAVLGRRLLRLPRA